MSYPNSGGAIQAYNQVGVESSVAYASPHQLIKVLLENALLRIGAAKNFIQRGRVPEKCDSISRALSIVEGLRLCLNKEAGGEIAQNLEDLYDYMERRLVQANLNNDQGILDEVISLLSQIKVGWDAIGDKTVEPPVNVAAQRMRMNIPAIG